VGANRGDAAAVDRAQQEWGVKRGWPRARQRHGQHSTGQGLPLRAYRRSRPESLPLPSNAGGTAATEVAASHPSRSATQRGGAAPLAAAAAVATRNGLGRGRIETGGPTGTRKMRYGVPVDPLVLATELSLRRLLGAFRKRRSALRIDAPPGRLQPDFAADSDNTGDCHLPFPRYGCFLPVTSLPSRDTVGRLTRVPTHSCPRDGLCRSEDPRSILKRSRFSVLQNTEGCYFKGSQQEIHAGLDHCGLLRAPWVAGGQPRGALQLNRHWQAVACSRPLHEPGALD